MSKVIRRRWHANFVSGIPRRDRAPCEYKAYVPDYLVGRKIVLDGDVAADVTDAEAAIAALNRQSTSLVDTEALARLLLRAESVASSRIEGLEVGARRLLRAEAARKLDDGSTNVTATEVLGNIDAMVAAIQDVTDSGNITLGNLLAAHSKLLANTRLPEHGGCVRQEQNWIGGSSYNPCSASFVPPPPELVPELLEDLIAFSNDDGVPAIVQAAIAHAQFETIHPFIDGNGRIGRVLIHLILRRRNLAPHTLPPISLILATRAQDYVDSLTATRYRGPATSKAAHQALSRWIALFAASSKRAVGDASAFEQRVREIQDDWRSRLGSIRADSATDLLIQTLPGAPVVTSTTASELIGRSFPATNAAIERLAGANVLSQVTVGRRNRAFEAPELIAAFTDFERQLASPAGSTRTSKPSRRVPARRQQ